MDRALQERPYGRRKYMASTGGNKGQCGKNGEGVRLGWGNIVAWE